jgi:hypothetical protein
MIFVYSHTVTNRLIYTLDVIFKNVLKMEYQLVDLETFKTDTSHAKLNYSGLDLENCVQVSPNNLLFDQRIENQEIKVDWIDQVPYFFKTSKNSTFEYDILASTFYMTSRYEEYLPSGLDTHNRFQAKNSLAYKNDFLEIPVVNIWAVKLKNALSSKFPFTEFLTQEFKHIDTFDIDIAYSYRGKNKLRFLLSSILSILKIDREEIKNRCHYFIKKRKDPFDVYDKISSSSNKIFFFLLGNYGKYDKNISHKSTVLKNLVQKLSSENEIGIHPSYGSHKSLKQLSKEKKRLEFISQKKTLKSRQHFLKFSLPETYENLISIGIKEDYSMGFASQVGFRAGICTPFLFYNLEKDRVTELIIYPFQVMDGTLNEYLKLSPNEAIEKINKIISEIKKVNGTFISLWHNSSLSEQKKWNGWTEVYEKLIKSASKK